MSEQPEKPWISVYDRYGDPDGYLSGNKEGLRILKESIEKVLESGEEVNISKELDADFVAVNLKEIADRNIKETKAEKIKNFGCLCCIATVIIVCILGIISLFKHGIN